MESLMAYPQTVWQMDCQTVKPLLSVTQTASQKVSHSVKQTAYLLKVTQRVSRSVTQMVSPLKVTLTAFPLKANQMESHLERQMVSPQTG